MVFNKEDFEHAASRAKHLSKPDILMEYLTQVDNLNHLTSYIDTLYEQIDWYKMKAGPYNSMRAAMVSKIANGLITQGGAYLNAEYLIKEANKIVTEILIQNKLPE